MSEQGIIARAAEHIRAAVDAGGGAASLSTTAASPAGCSPSAPPAVLTLPDAGPTPPRMVVPNRVIIVLFACVVAGADDAALYAIARVFQVNDMAYRFWRFANTTAIAELRRQNEAVK